jgi:hypothetical protein
MNVNQIINMIMRQVMRRLVNTGVNKGFDVAGQMGRKVNQPSRRQDDSGTSRGNTNNRG